MKSSTNHMEMVSKIEGGLHPAASMDFAFHSFNPC